MTQLATATHIDVLGVPAPQGSKSAFVDRAGRARMLEGGSTVGRTKHRAWRTAVAAAALEAQQHMDPDAPLAVTVRFVMPKPRSRPKYVVWCDRKPDLDKLVRSTLDGLADGGMVAHDSRVVYLECVKRYADVGEPTGAQIEVRVIGQDDTI